MDKILLVEDDEALGIGIKMALENAETTVKPCILLSEAKKILDKEEFDLVLLDINLPDGNGLTLLREIKGSKNMPVILLTARDLETDVVAGLTLGADDYVTKPFSLAVLRARVQVQLRRKSSFQTIQISDYIFDFEHQSFEKSGRKIELSQTEQKILKLLLKFRGSVVTREQLESYVWGSEWAYLDANTLSVALNRLRSKLEDTEHIKTIYGSGYSWKERVHE